MGKRVFENNKFGMLLTDSSSSEEENNKTMLCFTTVSGKKCGYGSKCSYAHTLKDQKVYSLRERAYDIITNKKNLSKIDFIKNRSLYNELLTLTRYCQMCEKGTCVGGYNCKHGVCKPLYQICIEDLNNGYCRFKNCKRVHLTDRGLTPFNTQKKIKDEEEDIFLRKERKINKRYSPDDPSLKGILLTDDNVKNYLNSPISTDSESESDIQRTIMYLNTFSDNEEEESIFKD